MACGLARSRDALLIALWLWRGREPGAFSAGGFERPGQAGGPGAAVGHGRRPGSARHGGRMSAPRAGLLWTLLQLRLAGEVDEQWFFKSHLAWGQQPSPWFESRPRQPWFHKVLKR